MKRRYTILNVLLLLVAAAVIAGMLLLSHTSSCAEATRPLPAGATPMKSVARRCYGSPEGVVRYEDGVKPIPGDDEVLVRVKAASVNPLDWHYVEGTPYLVRLDRGLGKPDDPRLGVDFAGTVEKVGKGVTRFKPGDEVFGGKLGALAQFVSIRETRAIALKPDNVSYEQAAAVPIAAITALQGLRDKGHVHAGQKVLINGASGGVGTYAVQIAKSMGAEVTGVCSTRNLELVRSLGADHVIDYTQEDFTQRPERYDVILDSVGTHSVLAYKRVLAPDGIYVMAGSTHPGNWFGWLETPIEGWLLSPFTSQKFSMFLADLNQEDLAVLASLMQSGKMSSAIDRSYKLSESAQALAYLEKGHARGKVVVTVE
ncbi:MAG TPA: NAD(P)-dependent alcohol dehydrogenase [Steroidobacteraceae bacterium]|nr:NAD(P)-dependent alcohol dehydrogenase [Steroidobacteraceae bacterium]